MSRNVPASLPSRNAVSGSISSPDASALAFLAMRCDSTASWLAKSTSRTVPPPCPICSPSCSASSSSDVLASLTRSRPAASDVSASAFCVSRSAALSTVSHFALISVRSSPAAPLVTASMFAPFASPPSISALRSAPNFCRLSSTVANACFWPCAASAEPRARRCDSICISVAVADCAAACDVVRESRNSISSASTANTISSVSSTWNCLTTGRLPMTGSLREVAASALALRSWSMIDTDASGS